MESSKVGQEFLFCETQQSEDVNTRSSPVIAVITLTCGSI